MGISWMKTGAESAKMAQQAEVEQQQQQDQKGKLWRFYLKDKEEARITFIDGEVSHDGHLIPPRYYEHSLELNGKWGNFFVCPEKTMPEAGHKCPICASGNKPSLVALFTIIDHREVKTKKGAIIKDQKRLLVAKSVTMEMLTKIAVKRGGLAGCTFDVSRMGENSAAVGSMFDFVEKNPLELLQNTFKVEIEENGQKKMVTIFTPADYEQEISFKTPEELLSLGLGASKAGGYGNYGGQMNPGGNQGTTDYSKSL